LVELSEYKSFAKSRRNSGPLSGVLPIFAVTEISSFFILR